MKRPILIVISYDSIASQCLPIEADIISIEVDFAFILVFHNADKISLFHSFFEFELRILIEEALF